jgi:predicted RNA-binding Zn ribbon-like protein
MVSVNDESRRLDSLDRVGGHPVLDFVNTVECWQGGNHGVDYLDDFDSLMHWHRITGLIGPAALRQLGRGSPRDREAAHREARHLRGSLQSILAAIANRAPLPRDALEPLNRIAAETAGRRKIRARKREFFVEWDFVWDFKGAPPRAILGPIAWLALELLRHGPLDRIKACPETEGCGWLFLDESKNRSRTWCSMKTCGNAAKARRFRARY